MAPSWLVLVVIAVAVIVLFKVAQFLWFIVHASRCLKDVPSWPTHWLYGNLHQIMKPDYFIKKAKWGSDNGVKISREWFGPFIPAIAIHHPDIWKQLLNKPKSSETYSMLEPWLGRGLLIADGKRWARNRRLLTGAFHFETIKPYMRIYNESSDVLVKKWTDSIIKGQPIPMYSDIARLTLDTLLKCSFSSRTNCQVMDVPYTSAINELSLLVRERYLSVPLRMLNDFIYFNFTSHGRRFKKSFDYVHKYAEDVIAERRKTLAELETDSTVDSKDLMARALQKGNRKSLDFLDILLMARDEEGRGLSDLEIRYEVDTFMFEGHDTTAHGLAWTLYCLAKHPEHQERCREEINEVYAGKDHLEYDDLPKLTYTQWCIKESMRLYPPVYIFVRETEADTTIDDHLIPKGTQVSIFSIHLHHNKEFWPDPEVFDPLRFHPDRISKQHPYAYTPFSAGPRNCIGQNFAMNEMREVVGTVLHNFKLSLIEGREVEIFPTVLYGFKGELPITLELLDK